MQIISKKKKNQSPKWNWLNHTPGCGARKSTMAVLTTIRPALACLRVSRAMYSAAANPLFSLQGKTALITGGARDIGQGCAIELARAGADVCINYNASAKDAEVRLLQITCTKLYSSSHLLNASRDIYLMAQCIAHAHASESNVQMYLCYGPLQGNLPDNPGLRPSGIQCASKCLCRDVTSFTYRTTAISLYSKRFVEKISRCSHKRESTPLSLTPPHFSMGGLIYW